MHRSDFDWHSEQIRRAQAGVDAKYPAVSQRRSRLRRLAGVVSEFFKLALILAVVAAVGAFLGAPL